MSRRYNYPKKPIKRDIEPSFENVKYLSCVSVPRVLYGVSLKNIISKKEYSSLKKDTRKRAKSNCEICGKYVSMSFSSGSFIYTQECYSISTSDKTFSYDCMLGVCKDCYYFLNPWIVNKELKEGNINSKYVTSITLSRYNLLNRFGFSSFSIDVNSVYVLVYKGNKYINDSNPSILSRALSAGVRVLPMKKDFYVMHSDLYYHKPLL